MENDVICNCTDALQIPIFLVQIALKIVASGFGFFAHKFEVFDATIVVLSWIIDVASE